MSESSLRLGHEYLLDQGRCADEVAVAAESSKQPFWRRGEGLTGDHPSGGATGEWLARNWLAAVILPLVPRH